MEEGRKGVDGGVSRGQEGGKDEIYLNKSLKMTPKGMQTEGQQKWGS